MIMEKPRPGHLKIVALETKSIIPIPDFPLPEGFTYEVAVHNDVSAEQLPSLIADADMVIDTVVPLGANTLSSSVSPKLKFIQVVGTGTDAVDLPAARARGIMVSNLAGGNAQTVAEHALGLYFACRREFGKSSEALRRNDWVTRGHLASLLTDGEGKQPLTMRDETVAFFGFGAVGQRIAALAQALGMKVMVAERKGRSSVREGRVPFQQALETASVLVICLPRLTDTSKLISTHEFNSMRRQAMLIDVSRGGIVDNVALLDALKEKRIAGAATDVYTTEPAGPNNSVLLTDDTRDLNLIVTPHLAWFSQETFSTFEEMLRENIVGWCLGRPKRVVI